ncbi:MAG: hypothetical protein ACYTFT_16660 [Planctomycetota bacterium]
MRPEAAPGPQNPEPGSVPQGTDPAATATETAPSPGTAPPATGTVARREARRDPWFEQFGDLMPAKVKARYLSTPLSERYETFAVEMLAIQEREALLHSSGVELEPDERKAYFGLPTLQEARHYLATRQ